MAIDFGLSTLSRGVLVSREAYLSVAQAAERAGFGFLSVNDHIIVPGTLGSAYPYTQGGAWAAAEHGHCFDQLATLAFLAGCTSRLRLLTSVMVVPHRPAISTAKMLATIDVLSGGRLILGVGAGWMKEEFGLLGAPFEERGAATDEYLEAFKALWTQERPSYSGKHVRFADVIFEPKPMQKPHPPIWVGGESPAALRRTVKLGDVWYPGNNSQTKPLDTPARLGRRHRRAAPHGRGGRPRPSVDRRQPDRAEPVRVDGAEGAGRQRAAPVHGSVCRHGGRCRSAGGAGCAPRRPAAGRGDAGGVARAHRPLRPRGDRVVIAGLDWLGVGACEEIESGALWMRTLRRALPSPSWGGVGVGGTRRATLVGSPHP